MGLDRQLDRLQVVCRGVADAPLEQVIDAVLDGFGRSADDVAVLAARRLPLAAPADHHAAVAGDDLAHRERTGP